MMCAERMNTRSRKISHAIAYCETMSHPHDPSEYTEMEILKGTAVSTDAAVRIMKQSVQQYNRTIPSTHIDIILKEMCTDEFKSYIAYKLAHE